MSYLPPAPPFIAARWHGDAQTPHRIVIHCTVSPCAKGGARAVARFFATETNKTSAHYVVDPAEVVQCVGDHTVAYHAPPNQDSIGVELCDPQSGAVKRWADADHEAMLRLAARLVAELCLAYDIPAKRLSVADLKAGKGGISGHADVSNAWHQTTHTDPGEGFPWDHFMVLVRAAVADLSAPAVPVVERTKPAPKHHPRAEAIATRAEAGVKATKPNSPLGKFFRAVAQLAKPYQPKK